MSPRCSELQQLVADRGPTALQRDLDGQEHLADCADCLGFVEALPVVDAASRSLPNHDAPQELLQRTLLAAAAGAVESARAARREIAVEIAPVLRAPAPLPQVPAPLAQRHRGWYRSRPLLGAMSGLAAAAFVVFVVSDASDGSGVSDGRDVQRDPPSVAVNSPAIDGDFGGGGQAGARAPSYAGPRPAEQDESGHRSAGNREDTAARGGDALGGTMGFLESTDDSRPRVAEITTLPSPAKVTVDGSNRNNEPATSLTPGRYSVTTQAPPPASGSDDSFRRKEDQPAADEPTIEARHYASGYEAVEKSVVLDDGLKRPAGKLAAGSKGDRKSDLTVATKDVLNDKRDKDKAEDKAEEASVLALAARRGAVSDSEEEGGFELKLVAQSGKGLEHIKQFLAERAAVEGLTFQPATGYWANGYVPGDPVLRLLQARLAGGDRSQLSHRSGDVPELDGAARPYLQSFDPPKTAALGVTVRADRRSADGPTRMLLQVGLKGTARQSGRRPAMNIGIVLDVRDASSSEVQASLRGLLSALLASKQVGDRFSLTVAGRPGGLVLTADNFKNGPLTVAMRQLFGDGTELAGATLSLPEALERASQEVLGTDDPTAPLGSSLTLLITATPLNATEFPQLVDLAHANAVDGIGLSAVGVGESVDADQLTQLAAAGQGNRRLLLKASDASRVVERELSAVGAVVARALRVRIRLAPGVKLVDVIGSHRLDVAGAQRARDAETSIDRRLARARGITADRGDDEDGIQIIIPSFYAGDSHVILLDVVVDGPGAIADVSVRYKDLVFLRNGVARDSLELRRGEVQATKVERGVFKNYVAHRVAMDLRSAGKALAAGDLEVAAQRLASLDELLTGLPSEVPELAKDTEFSRDAAMVAEYLDLLTGGNLRDDGRPYVADSLLYAGWRKLVPVRDESD